METYVLNSPKLGPEANIYNDWKAFVIMAEPEDLCDIWMGSAVLPTTREWAYTEQEMTEAIWAIIDLDGEWLGSTDPDDISLAEWKFEFIRAAVNLAAHEWSTWYKIAPYECYGMYGDEFPKLLADLSQLCA